MESVEGGGGKEGEACVQGKVALPCSLVRGFAKAFWHDVTCPPGVEKVGRGRLALWHWSGSLVKGFVKALLDDVTCLPGVAVGTVS